MEVLLRRGRCSQNTDVIGQNRLAIMFVVVKSIDAVYVYIHTEEAQ